MARAKSNKDQHWLVRPQSIRLMWRLFIAVLVATVLGDFVVEHKPKFGIDGAFGFAAWFGFLACVSMVAFAKALGAILKRSDTYYDD